MRTRRRMRTDDEASEQIYRRLSLVLASIFTVDRLPLMTDDNFRWPPCLTNNYAELARSHPGPYSPLGLCYSRFPHLKNSIHGLVNGI